MAVSTSKRVLVLSVALNGYQWLYRDCLNTHKAYAKRHGYQYLLIDRPTFTALGVECCWLKLFVMRMALLAGYQKVIFIDADAKVSRIAPNLEHVNKRGKSVYMAKGYSGRFNSGVLIISRSHDSINWLNDVIAMRKSSLPDIDKVGWGENGYIIHLSKDKPFIGVLSVHWNNTFDTELDDYIRHFNFGPMRKSVFLGAIHKSLATTTRVIRGCRRLLGKVGLLSYQSDSMQQLVAAVLRHYSEDIHLKQTLLLQQP